VLKATGADPLRLLLLSFAALIVTGTLLLMLPAATPPDSPIGLIDAFFTATSATCVTGLVVRDTGAGFTTFGQVVILCLIQLGGLGIMTFSLMLMGVLGRRVPLVYRSLVLQTLASNEDRAEFRPLLRTVLKFTLATETIGAALLFARWQPEMGTAAAAYAAVFHSISAFCNAGFSLWSDSISGWRGDAMTNFVMCALIVLGGLGFLTVHEVISSRGRSRAMSVHTRLVLYTTGVLIVGGAAAFWMLESNGVLSGMPGGESLLVSMFQSVTCRTAGFNTIDFALLAPATLFVMILLMAVGGSPGSCAGGLKTTTLAVLALAVWNRLHGRTRTNVFNRTLPTGSVSGALTLAAAAVAVMIAGLFLLLLLEPVEVVDRHGVFMGYFFEIVSALGTVGLSTGVTPELQPASRVLVAVLMFVGRVGTLTVAGSLVKENPDADWQYPEEEVMIG